MAKTNSDLVSEIKLLREENKKLKLKNDQLLSIMKKQNKIVRREYTKVYNALKKSYSA